MSFSLNEYQYLALRTADYPDKGSNLLYPALGLAEEGGEVAGKIKKLWRNDGITNGHKVPEDKREAIVKELGDALWYISAVAMELGVTLETVANKNIDKLCDRQARGVIKSEGDNR